MPGFKPMLAAKIDTLETLRFPLLLSAKLDGIRATIKDGRLISRNLKDIPNRYIFNELSYSGLEGLDGELIVGAASGPGVFNRTTSAVMSRDGEPEFRYFVFDSSLNPVAGWERRMAGHLWNDMPPQVILLPQQVVANAEQVEHWERRYLGEGYEGVMLRDPHAPYKYGRSTLTEQKLMKLKRFEDSEAQITGVEELRSNQNEATINELGYTERTSHKANMVMMGTLGALVVRDDKLGMSFKIGTGFTAAQRAALWESRERLTGLIVKYKYQPVGVKDAPRFPVFLGFRATEDL
jgi:DNA ligase-1